LALLVKVCMVYKFYGENTSHLNIIKRKHGKLSQTQCETTT